MADYISSIKRSPVVHLMFGITFIISGLIINLIQAVSFCTVRPLSKHLYRRINFYLCRSYQCQIIFLAVWWASIDLIIHVNENELNQFFAREHACVLGNHRYDIDWLIAWMFSEHYNILGNLKTFVKREYMYIPTFGWAFYFGDYCFVPRNREQAKVVLSDMLTELADYQDPILLAFPAEGTRFTEEKCLASRKFAKERGLPLLEHHLLPRPTGFTTIRPYFEGKIKAIYNYIICFNKGESPTLRDLLYGKKIHAHTYVERIPMNEVPIEEKECAKWLYNLFARKDHLLDNFFKTGDFVEGKETQGFHVPRTYFVLFSALGWFTVVIGPILNFLFQLLMAGSLVYLSIMIGMLYILSWSIEKLIDVSDTTKSSSYGK